MKSPFGGVQFVPGVGWVEGGLSGGNLGDDSSIMMISGFGQDQPMIDGGSALTEIQKQEAARQTRLALANSQSTSLGFLADKFLGVPLWAWLIVGAIGAVLILKDRR